MGRLSPTPARQHTMVPTRENRRSGTETAKEAARSPPTLQRRSPIRREPTRDARSLCTGHLVGPILLTHPLRTHLARTQRKCSNFACHPLSRIEGVRERPYFLYDMGGDKFAHMRNALATKPGEWYIFHSTAQSSLWLKGRSGMFGIAVDRWQGSRSPGLPLGHQLSPLRLPTRRQAMPSRASAPFMSAGVGFHYLPIAPEPSTGARAISGILTISGDPADASRSRGDAMSRQSSRIFRRLVVYCAMRHEK